MYFVVLQAVDVHHSSYEASDFMRRPRTYFLSDLRLRHMSSNEFENIDAIIEQDFVR